MKRLFLTSSVASVAHDIGRKIEKKGLKLAFILTPTEVEEGDLDWLKKDRQSLIDTGFKLTDYTFTGKNKTEIKKFLNDFDGIYMSGGNTFWFLKKIQESDCAQVIKDFVSDGKLYISTSAGSIIAGPDIFPTRNLEKFAKVPELKDYTGLNLVNFIIKPHWGGQNFKAKYINKRMENSYSEKYPIVLLPDNSYIEVEDDSYKIIQV